MVNVLNKLSTWLGFVVYHPFSTKTNKNDNEYIPSTQGAVRCRCKTYSVKDEFKIGPKLKYIVGHH